MKILYVNGIKFKKMPSRTYQLLKKAMKDDEVYQCEWVYGDDVKEKIDECIERVKPDVIVASSTAGLFVTDYDIPVILINPVVDRQDLEDLFPDKDFSNYPEKPSKKSNRISVILGENDKVLDYKKAMEFFDNADIRIVKDEHQLNNIEPVIKELNILKKEWSGLC